MFEKVKERNANSESGKRGGHMTRSGKVSASPGCTHYCLAGEEAGDVSAGGRPPQPRFRQLDLGQKKRKLYDA